MTNRHSYEMRERERELSEPPSNPDLFIIIFRKDFFEIIFRENANYIIHTQSLEDLV